MTETTIAIIIIFCSVVWLGGVFATIGYAVCKQRMISKTWTSVHEGMPTEEDGDWVLAYVHINDKIDNFEIIAAYVNGEWRRDVDYAKLSALGMTVTHWMPLPEPPKENKFMLEV